MVKLLVGAGAATEATDQYGRTLPSSAVQFRHTEVVKLLLHASAAVETMDGDKMTPLSRAASNGHTETQPASKKWCRYTIIRYREPNTDHTCQRARAQQRG